MHLNVQQNTTRVNASQGSYWRQTILLSIYHSLKELHAVSSNIDHFSSSLNLRSIEPIYYIFLKLERLLICTLADPLNQIFKIMSVPTQQSHAVPVHHHAGDETQHGMLNLNAQ